MATEVAAAVDPTNTGFTIEDDRRLLQDLGNKPYKAQACWFLNAFWKQLFQDNPEEAERVWDAHAKIVELDSKKEDGCKLDQLCSHRFLEKIDKALTVVELRETLADIDKDHDKSMSLVEFFVYRYKVDWRVLVHAPQGEVDEAKLALAEEKVEEAKKDIATSELRAEEARQALKESVDKEVVAKSEAAAAAKKQEEATASAQRASEKEAAAKVAEAKAVDEESEAFQNESLAKEAEKKATAAAEEQMAIQAQVEEALACVQREQDTFKATCDKLEALGNNESEGIVKRNAAKAELAQLRAGDPLPLQRAIISHNACVRRQERLTKTAAAAQLAAQSARSNAEKSREQAVRAREQASEERSVATSAFRQAEQHRNAAEQARDDADAAKEAAEQARLASEKFKAQAEQALAKSVASFQEATRFLEQVKKECSGAGKGKLWWMWRELEESKKYMSKAQLARLEAAPPLGADITPSVA